MTDVNEEIVRKFFELKGYLVRTNVRFMVKKKSSGYSDIDLAIYNPETDEKAIVEVKGWHTSKLTPALINQYHDSIFSFTYPEALDYVEKLFKTKKFKKILVTSRLPISQEKRNETLKIIKDNKIDEIILFNEILKFVIDKVNPNENYRDSEFLQTVRLLKNYNFLK